MVDARVCGTTMQSTGACKCFFVCWLCTGFLRPNMLLASHGFPRLPEILDFCLFFTFLFDRNSLIVRGNDTNNTFSFSKLPSASKSEIEVSETLTPIVFSLTTFSCVLPLALAPGQYLCSNIFSQQKPKTISNQRFHVAPSNVWRRCPCS